MNTLWSTRAAMRRSNLMTSDRRQSMRVAQRPPSTAIAASRALKVVPAAVAALLLPFLAGCPKQPPPPVQQELVTPEPEPSSAAVLDHLTAAQKAADMADQARADTKEPSQSAMDHASSAAAADREAHKLAGLGDAPGTDAAAAQSASAARQAERDAQDVAGRAAAAMRHAEQAGGAVRALTKLAGQGQATAEDVGTARSAVSRAERSAEAADKAARDAAQYARAARSSANEAAKRRTHAKTVSEVNRKLADARRASESASRYRGQAQRLAAEAAQAARRAAGAAATGDVARAAQAAAEAGARARKARQAALQADRAAKAARDGAKDAADLCEGKSGPSLDRTDEISALTGGAAKSARDAGEAARSAADAASEATEDVERTKDMPAAAKGHEPARPGSRVPATKPAVEVGSATKPVQPRGLFSRRESGGKVRPADIPSLPARPKPRPAPRGLAMPTSRPAGGQAAPVGRWRQVLGANAADFLPGGYAGSVLVFRGDGVLEVTRSFGSKGELSQTWRISYAWGEGRRSLVLGADPKKRPSPASLKPLTIEEMGIRTQPPTTAFPVTVPCSRTKDGRLVIASKTYAGPGR